MRARCACAVVIVALTAACGPAAASPSVSQAPSARDPDSLLLDVERLADALGSPALKISIGPVDLPNGHVPPVCSEDDQRMTLAIGGRQYLARPDTTHLIVGVHVVEASDAAAAASLMGQVRDLFASCASFTEGSALSPPKWWTGSLLLSIERIEDVTAGDEAFVYSATADHDSQGPLDEPVRVCWIYARVASEVAIIGVFSNAGEISRDGCEALAKAAANRLAT